jgi:hypothetical protein
MCDFTVRWSVIMASDESTALISHMKYISSWNHR